MTWSNIKPFPSIKAGSAALPGVALSATRPDGRFRPALRILIRPESWVNAPPAWLALGQSVSVQVGYGADFGQMRLVPPGPFIVRKSPGRNSVVWCVTVPVLPHQEKANQQSTACEYTVNDDWLAITLPTWCRPGAAVVQPALSPDAVARLRASAGRAA